eukprot:271702_1
MTTSETTLVIGLMSGTSLDGVDVALIKTDGYLIQDRIAFITYPYPNQFRQRVKSILGSTQYNNTLKDIEKELTLYHHKAILYLCKMNKINIETIKLIGFHGQTIYHKSFLSLHEEEIKSNSDVIKGKNCATWQIGDASLLFKQFNGNIPVKYNLRYNDILNGGQGAPLAPIYHAAIAFTQYLNDNTFEFPVCFINIGGISNVTYVDINENISLNDIKMKANVVELLYDNLILKAFDIGAGNCILDDWIEYATNNQYTYDKDGIYSMNGCVEEKDINFFVKQFMCHSFFNMKPPKTLDRNDLHKHLWNVLGIEHKYLCYFSFAKICNIAQIIVNCTCYSIVDQIIKYCCQNNKKYIPKTWLICGGGRRNPYIMKCIKKYCNYNAANTIKVIPIEKIGYNGDGTEAEAWAFLAVRSQKGLYISTPSTTGVDKAVTGGDLIE